jgi:hypothetical protein
MATKEDTEENLFNSLKAIKSMVFEMEGQLKKLRAEKKKKEMESCVPSRFVN